MKMNPNPRLVVSLGFTLALVAVAALPAAAATIGFEAPGYTVGAAPPAPWQNNGHAVVGSDAHTGAQALDTVEWSSTPGGADYGMASLTFPQVDHGSLSVYVRPSTDISGANFLNLAAVRLRNGFDELAADAYFALNDYGFTLGHPAANAWDAKWWAGWSNSGAAKFESGGWYNVTFSWDVPANQITVKVVGTGVNGTGSGSIIHGSAPTKVELAGGGIIGGHATFDDLTVAVPEPTGTLLFATGMMALVCWRKRRTDRR